MDRESLDAVAHTMSRGQYQARRGVHRPWIAEIHPGVQYARLSKRARAEYDRKRAAEWDASSQCYKDWVAALTATFDGGVSPDAPEVYPDAAKTYWSVKRQRTEAEQEAAKQVALQENNIQDVSQIKAGDVVYSLLGAGYGKVLRVFRKSVRLQWARPMYVGGPTESTVNVGALQWMHYDEVCRALEEGRPIIQGALQSPDPAMKERLTALEVVN